MHIVPSPAYRFGREGSDSFSRTSPASFRFDLFVSGSTGAPAFMGPVIDDVGVTTAGIELRFLEVVT